MDRPLSDLLNAAVERGVISAAQHDALRALAGEFWPESTRSEAPRGFNWVSVAYALGALLVIFASVWFLAERWRALGPAGVLGVAAGYAAVLAAMHRGFARGGFPFAAAIAAMLAVAVTPIIVWAAQSLSGWWPEGAWGMPYRPYGPSEWPRWIVVELATIGVAIVAFRRTRYVTLTVPIAAALWGVGFHLPMAFAAESAPLLERWAMLSAALLVVAAADTADRRQPRPAAGLRWESDYAFAFWLVGLLGTFSAMLAFWPVAGALRHATPLLAFALVAASLVLRRRTHLLFGILTAFLYLIYLAGEVFRDQALFPLLLALVGALLIVATVWMQKRFPGLASRIEARRGSERRGLPGAAWIPWSVAGVAFVGALLQYPDAAEEARAREQRERLDVLRQHSGSAPRPQRAPAQPLGARPTPSSRPAVPRDSG